MNIELEQFFKSEKIEYYGVVPFSVCNVIRKHLLEKEEGFLPRSVICYAVPYYTGEGDNISKYAISRDYHLYMASFSQRLCDCLQKTYKGCRVLGFSDHSPIEEVSAAVKGGLGVLGDNGLLITKKYSSFVFIGEVIIDIEPKELGCFKTEEIKYCYQCGRCKNKCPTQTLVNRERECLSSITQKKGELQSCEKNLIIGNNTAWGCDICQNVCPYTQNAISNDTIITPIQYFHENKISELTCSILDCMDERQFSRRAYAWRKRETIKRNLCFLEKAKNDKLCKTFKGE